MKARHIVSYIIYLFRIFDWRGVQLGARDADDLVLG